MSRNEMVSMIETMNNYDELAAKAKAKADTIREAIKGEMLRQGTEELVVFSSNRLNWRYERERCTPTISAKSKKKD